MILEITHSVHALHQTSRKRNSNVIIMIEVFREHLLVIHGCGGIKVLIDGVWIVESSGSLTFLQHDRVSIM